MYLVKRGPMENALDYVLQKQAERMNIPVIYESKLTANDVNIIAIGRHNPNYVANGIIFSFDHPDRVIALLDDRLSFKMYAYFIVDDHIGQIVSINPAQRKDHITRFNLTVKRFEEILNQEIGPINHRFAAAGSLHVLNRAKINHRYLIGEAAGFQDCLAGFGMMYAFKSGYHAAQSIINDDTRNKLGSYHPSKISTDYYEQCDGNDHMSKILYTDMKTFLPGDILVKVDRMSMANSLEVRAPLLDYQVIEFAAGLPSKLKFNSGEKKYLLKEAFKDDLPGDILYRKKMGFSVPLGNWLRGEIKSLTQKTLFDSKGGLNDYFKMEAIQKLWDEHQSGKRDHAKTLWCLLMFQMWWNHYMAPE